MKKLSLLLLFASFSLIGCRGKNNNPSDGGGEGGKDGGETEPVIDPTLDITVNYYLDYNQVAAKNIYSVISVKNGSKLEKPDDPANPPLPEFPVFKGWSKKEVIDNVSDLWNFDVDVVSVTSGTTLNLFGIWVAQGE